MMPRKPYAQRNTKSTQLEHSQETSQSRRKAHFPRVEESPQADHLLGEVAEVVFRLVSQVQRALFQQLLDGLLARRAVSSFLVAASPSTASSAAPATPSSSTAAAIVSVSVPAAESATPAPASP